MSCGRILKDKKLELNELSSYLWCLFKFLFYQNITQSFFYKVLHTIIIYNT